MTTFSTAFVARAAALSLAAVVSFALLDGIDHIANQQVSDVVMAQSAAPAGAAATQVVVVTGHRLPKA
jgi:hypothetical protein